MGIICSRNEVLEKGFVELVLSFSSEAFGAGGFLMLRAFFNGSLKDMR